MPQDEAALTQEADVIVGPDHFVWCEGGEYTVGDVSTGFVSLLESTGLFESSGARAERHGGTVVVTKPYNITRRSVSTEDYCSFLNKTANHSPGALVSDFVTIREYGNIEFRAGFYLPQQGAEGHPVNSATYAGASAFCEHVGAALGFRGRLPSESEWLVADQLHRFPVEYASGDERIEIGNWTSDYYSDTLRAITREADSPGPAECGFVIDGVNSRVVRYPIDATQNRRGWGFEGPLRSSYGAGFRVVVEFDLDELP